MEEFIMKFKALIIMVLFSLNFAHANENAGSRHPEAFNFNADFCQDALISEDFAARDIFIISHKVIFQAHVYSSVGYSLGKENMDYKICYEAIFKRNQDTRKCEKVDEVRIDCEVYAL